MRIPSGKIDQKITFVAVDSTDLKTRETGLSSFTVYRSRNGGTAAVYTTPTVTELDATNMPGVYTLLVDEDTTIASGSDSEEYTVHITQAAMAPVTRTIELYRRDTTSGQTVDVSSGGVEVGTFQAGAITAAAFAAGAIDNAAIATDAIGSAELAASAVTEIQTGLATATALATAQTSLNTIGGYLDTEIAAILAAVDTEVGAIKTKTDNLPTDPADASDIAASFSTVNGTLAAIAAYIDTEVAAIKTKTDQLTFTTTNRVDSQVVGMDADTVTASAVANSAITEMQSGLATGAALAAIDGKVDTVDTVVDAINLKTANLPSDPADESVVIAATSAVLSAVNALNNLSEPDVRSALGLASANLDSQLAALPKAEENAIGMLDLADGVEPGLTVRQQLRLAAAVLFGKASGLETTVAKYRDMADSKDRIAATVDAVGNRAAVSLDAS